jgi:hypothetical protein
VPASVDMVLYRRQSSADNLAFDLTLEGRSLLKARNSGPRTIPLGTPDVTGEVGEKWPSTITRYI